MSLFVENKQQIEFKKATSYFQTPANVGANGRKFQIGQKEKEDQSNWSN